MGVNIDDGNLNHFRFADDIVFITVNLGDAQKMVAELTKASTNVNFQKTKFWVNLIASNYLRIDGEEIVHNWAMR